MPHVMHHALFDDDDDGIIALCPKSPLDVYIRLGNAIFLGNALHGLHQNTWTINLWQRNNSKRSFNRQSVIAITNSYRIRSFVRGQQKQLTHRPYLIGSPEIDFHFNTILAFVSGNDLVFSSPPLKSYFPDVYSIFHFRAFAWTLCWKIKTRNWTRHAEQIL